MKKVIVLILMVFSIAFCFGCNGNEYNNSNLNISEELSSSFKIAYANSISQYMESVDLNEIEIIDYYGTIGDAHLVSIKSSYLGSYLNDKYVYPNGAYIDQVEKMEFRYDIGYKVYIIYNDILYTAKEAYNKKIINFDNLCMIFGIHTSKIDTFNESSYRKLENCMKLSYKEKSDLYVLEKYYGEYNGYSVVSYGYQGMQLCVSSKDIINRLVFEYGYESNHIRVMNDTNMYSMHRALNENIITNEDIYYLFKLHTGSEEVNENLVNKLLTPAYELCLKYSEDFDRELTLDSFYLDKYYGKYGDSFIYSLYSVCWINFTSTSATPEEIEIMEYGFSQMAYVLNENKLYTLNQAIELGIVDAKIQAEITAKYYGYF